MVVFGDSLAVRSFHLAFSRIVVVTAALLFAASLSADELCVLATPPRCTALDNGATLDTAPADPYVIRSAESLAFGTLPARGTPIRVRFSPLEKRFSAASLRISVRTPSSELTWTIAAQEARQLTTLVMPRDARSVTISTERHVPLQLDLAKHRPKSTWEVGLTRKPALTGRVIDLGGLPVPNAVIVTPDEKTITVTGPSGIVDADWEEPAPPFVTVHAPSYASRRTTVSGEGSDLSIGLVQLLRGGTLALRIDSAEPLGTLNVAVRRKREDGPGSYLVHESKIDGAAATIENLDPGDYVIEIAGAEPLQRAAVDATIRDLDTTPAVIDVRPTKLTITARLGSAPVSGAPMRVTSATFGWKAELTTDDEGTARGELWQQGRYSCAIKPPATSPYTTFQTIPEQKEFTWSISLPERSIVAIVVDAATRRPVAGARVELTTRLPGRGHQVVGQTDEQGRHTFSIVSAGAQTLTASADGYVPSEADRFVMTDDEMLHEATVELTRGKEITLAAHFNNGAPAAGLTALVLVGQEVEDTAQTDASGLATLTVPPAGSSLVIVTTATGSFALRRLSASHGTRETVNVVVPPTEAALRLGVRDSEGKPVPGVAFLFRYNGEFIPVDVLPPTHPLNLRTSSAGSASLSLPLGSYEIWPYRAFTEAQAIVGADGAGVGKAAISAAPGLNDVTFTLDRR